MNMDSAVAYACSPRPNGNTDCAVRCLQQGARQAGRKLTPLFLREHPVAPCRACSVCAAPPHTCVLDHGNLDQNTVADNMVLLSTPLLRASILFFAAPIFFYHLPAQFKAFMDRTQRFYLMKQKNAPSIMSLAPRTAYIVLLGAREQGARLFEGSLLSLRLMLDIFNIVPAEPLLLYGLDAPAALSENQELQARVTAYAYNAFPGAQNLR